MYAVALVFAVGCSPLAPQPPHFSPPNPYGSIYQPPFDLGALVPPISPPVITDGLPVGAAINLTETSVFWVDRGRPFSGGALGGERSNSRATLQVTLDGTGSLASFHTVVHVPLICAVDAGPHASGGLSQSFPTDMAAMQGQIIGDPDFDLLRIRAGSAFGMPSPGHTTLTRGSLGADWAVDSFFDVTYRIEFVGTPGGRLSGMSGSTTTTAHFQIGDPMPPAPAPLTINPGVDLWTTQGNGLTYQDFPPSNPIPANFFGPGSDPFVGRIEFTGSPLLTNPPGLAGPTDTIVRRSGSASLLDIGGMATVPIELVGLSLVSVQPITVTYSGGQMPEPWNVRACMSAVQPQQPGGMTVVRDSDAGGTFTSTLPVMPRLIFTRPIPPRTVTADPLPPIIFSASGTWVSTPDPQLQLFSLPPGVSVDGRCNGAMMPLGVGTSNFVPGVLSFTGHCEEPPGSRPQVKRLTTEQAMLAAHGILPSQHPTPDVDLDGFADDADNCPNLPNPSQADLDQDGWGDGCDNCPSVANLCQSDENTNGIGDACDAAPTCLLAGDVNGDTLVDGNDVPGFMQNLVTGSSPGNNRGCCDMDADGIVDQRDLRPFVMALLGTSDLYLVPIDMLAGAVTTDAGAQPTTVFGTLKLMIGAPVTPGVRPINVAGFTLGARSVPTLINPTGGMTFTHRVVPGGGSLNMVTHQIDLQMDYDVSYGLLDQLFPPEMPDINPAFNPEQDEHVSITEHWTGALHGTATPTVTGDALTLSTTLTIMNVENLNPGVTLCTCSINIPIPVKEFSLIYCPKGLCNKKILCIQPIFIKDNAGDANPSGSSYADYKAAAETQWAKCCVELDFQAPITIVCPGGKAIDDINTHGGGNRETSPKLDGLFGKSDPTGNNDCVEVFFVSSMSDAQGRNHAWGDGDTRSAGTQGTKVAVSDASDCNPRNNNLLAHELGHAMGLRGHGTGGVMTPTGKRPNCPGSNPSFVSKEQCEGLNNPLLKEKEPKEECCKNYDEAI